MEDFEVLKMIENVGIDGERRSAYKGEDIGA